MSYNTTGNSAVAAPLVAPDTQYRKLEHFANKATALVEQSGNKITQQVDVTIAGEKQKVPAQAPLVRVVCGYLNLAAAFDTETNHPGRAREYARRALNEWKEVQGKRSFEVGYQIVILENPGFGDCVKLHEAKKSDLEALAELLATPVQKELAKKPY